MRDSSRQGICDVISVTRIKIGELGVQTGDGEGKGVTNTGSSTGKAPFLL